MVYLKKGVPLMCTLEGVSSVAKFITAYKKKTQKKKKHTHTHKKKKTKKNETPIF